ncbi:MAG: hypothetical protein PHD43_24205 [Methylococcales bacterium]|nr:hypothetical protein [Methylococcales bacterium]
MKDIDKLRIAILTLDRDFTSGDFAGEHTNARQALTKMERRDEIVCVGMKNNADSGRPMKMYRIANIRKINPEKATQTSLSKSDYSVANTWGEVYPDTMFAPTLSGTRRVHLLDDSRPSKN